MFLHTYTKGHVSLKKDREPKNILDKWLLARLYGTVDAVTRHLEKYRVGEAGREVSKFVSDLSRWYIRRSRRRFQPARGGGDKKEDKSAAVTLGFALLETSKLISPFIPFFAEALYQSLKGVIYDYDFQNSVHLESWARVKRERIDKKLLREMEEVRTVASLTLSLREEAGIKVRQPLTELKIKSGSLKGKKELLQLLMEEVNVKKITFEKDLSVPMELDTRITHKLKEEGLLREVVRKVQKMRQDAGLFPEEEITLGIEGEGELGELVKRETPLLKSEVRATKISPRPLSSYDLDLETRIEDFRLRLTLKKI